MPGPGLKKIPESEALGGLWLSLLVGGTVWAVMVPFYFIGDDFEHLARAKGPMFASLWDLAVSGQSGAFLRPVGFASIFLDYRLYGSWPPGYHLTSLAIHLASVAGVYYLSRELRFGSQIASTASLIYAVLPVEVEAVAWMGARFDLLSACFTIWGAVFFMRYRWSGKIGKYVLALMCFFLATLSKENAYVFPLLLLAAEYLVLPKWRWRPLGGCFLLAIALFLISLGHSGRDRRIYESKRPAGCIACRHQGPGRFVSAGPGSFASRLQLGSAAAGGNDSHLFVDRRSASDDGAALRIGAEGLEG
jgi:hypothetical protein